MPAPILELHHLSKRFGDFAAVDDLSLDIAGGEFLTLLGAFKANTWVATLAATGLILGAAYALWLYRKVVFGELTKDSLKGILDMNRREIAVFLPLVLLSLWMGVYPASFLDPMAASVDKLVGDYQAAIKLARTAALP